MKPQPATTASTTHQIRVWKYNFLVFQKESNKVFIIKFPWSASWVKFKFGGIIVLVCNQSCTDKYLKGFPIVFQIWRGTYQELWGSQDIQSERLDPGVMDAHLPVDPRTLNADEHTQVSGQPSGPWKQRTGMINWSKSRPHACLKCKLESLPISLFVRN